MKPGKYFRYKIKDTEIEGCDDKGEASRLARIDSIVKWTCKIAVLAYLFIKLLRSG